MMKKTKKCKLEIRLHMGINVKKGEEEEGEESKNKRIISSYIEKIGITTIKKRKM